MHTRSLQYIGAVESETDRLFIEGKSELVSGFNVEYFKGGFALIFIAGYGTITFLVIILFF